MGLDKQPWPLWAASVPWDPGDIDSARQFCQAFCEGERNQTSNWGWGNLLRDHASPAGLLSAQRQG